MKHSKAIQHLTVLMLNVQKWRSVVRETFLPEDGGMGFAEEVLEMHEPFIFGPKSILAGLLKVLEGDDPVVSLADFFNLMTMARFLDDYTLIAMYGIDENDWPPEPNIDWIRDGWEPEGARIAAADAEGETT